MRSSRAEAFSDGVFAIAITLLVLDLRLPGPRPGCVSLTCQLLGAWPHYFAYVVSFLTIGIMWMNHHTVLGHVTTVDRPLLILNLLLLMGVVAVPFPTALVAETLHGPGGGPAAVTYGLVMIAIAACFSGVWAYVVRHARKLGAGSLENAFWRSVPRFSAGLAGYVAATVVAASGAALAALVIYGLIAVYYLFEHLPEPAGETSE